MKLEVDTIDRQQKILIVAKEKFDIVNRLQSQLEKLGGDVYYSPALPKSLSSFDISFVVNEKNYLSLLKKPVKKLIMIYIDHDSFAQHIATTHPPKTKVISIIGNLISENEVDRILWFSFSQSKEKFIKLLAKKAVQKLHFKFLKPVYDLTRFLRLKNLIWAILVLFLLMETFFIIPLTITSYLSYRTYINFKNENVNQSTDSLGWQKLLLDLTEKTYSIAKPALLFLSIAKLPDDFIEINKKVSLVLTKTRDSQTGVNQIIGLILKKDKTDQEKQLIKLRFKHLNSDLDEMSDSLSTISNKLPSTLPRAEPVKKSIVDGLNLISQFKKIVPYFDEILAKNNQKKYLLLFANNMELRPGGGFIGSFGVLNIEDYTLKEIKVYDVYDADGQLKAHIDPPAAIRNYLKQPHWFLRDSAFSPDFLDNYTQAKFFLEKELSWTGFDGAILITTTAIENILSSFGNLYLPDFQEMVNSKNFYLKAQTYSEKDFFPGSIQKKTFLSSVLQQALINLETASSRKLIAGVKKSFDEKQLVVYFENQPLQQIIDSLFWSGRIIKTKCFETSKNCLIDFIMPVDANLGINKANFFIDRLINLKTEFQANGTVNHLLSVVFKNESPSDVFPGGKYKNYFQVYLPKEIKIKSVTQNGVSIDKNLLTDEIKDDWFRILGLLVEVKPKSSTEIKINYQLDNRFPRGQNTYQLVIQKQIGSANNDFVSEIYLTQGYSLISQNFIPLVKDNQILYNTSLSTDKIFVVELIKQ